MYFFIHVDRFESYTSAGYPLISHFTSRPLSKMGGFNIGGINSTGQARNPCESYP
jgi:hypothetical protein